MWPLGVFNNIGINTFYELRLRFVLCTIDLFPLHRYEKEPHDSIVVGLTKFRKGLDNLVHLKH